MRGRLITASLALAAAAANAQPVRVSTAPGRQPDSLRMYRGQATPEEIRMLTFDIRLLVEREVRVSNELDREAEIGNRDRVEALTMELSRVHDDLQRLNSRLSIGCMGLRQYKGVAEGYLGLTPDSMDIVVQSFPPMGEIDIESAQFVRSPRIALIEPGSAADKAGVRVGDEWIAIDGRAVLGASVGDINAALKPGARVTITVRRDGSDLDLPLTATKRALFYPDAECRNTNFAIQAPFMPRAAMIFRRPSAVPAPRSPDRLQIQVLVYSEAFVTYGARFKTLDKDERDFVEFQGDGVFVQQVLPDTPAERAGLRAYDVVVSANGVAVASPAELRRINNGSTALTLLVVRKNERRTVVLGSR